MLCAFLNLQNSLVCTFDNFDYEEILHYNFKDDLVQEFEQIHETYYMSKCIGCTFNKGDISEFVNEEEIEEFMFRRAMMDNQNAISETSNRLDGVSEIEGRSIFMPSIMPTILTFIDNGKAALRSFFDNSTCKYVSKVFPGEQAFRIMEDKFKKYLLYLHHIERYSKIHNKNSYDLYREFTLYMLQNGLIAENSTKSLLDYIKILEDTNQQISDVYVYDVMCKDDLLEVVYNNFMKGK